MINRPGPRPHGFFSHEEFGKCLQFLQMGKESGTPPTDLKKSLPGFIASVGPPFRDGATNGGFPPGEFSLCPLAWFIKRFILPNPE
jgi:hypothetical protein